MVDTLEPMIDAPIAGQSLTAELGNRPWQQPPQYSTVEDALQYYIPRLTNPEMLDDLLNVMETGIPLTTLANAIQSSGVMEGKHSLDIGILIMPVLMETMAYLAEESGIEYEVGTKRLVVINLVKLQLLEHWLWLKRKKVKFQKSLKKNR